MRYLAYFEFIVVFVFFKSRLWAAVGIGSEYGLGQHLGTGEMTWL